jgi:Lon protease-like protein
LLLVLVLATYGHKLLLELMHFLFELIPLPLGFQGEPEFQRFETRMDVVLRRIHHGSRPLGLSVGRK